MRTLHITASGLIAEVMGREEVELEGGFRDVFDSLFEPRPLEDVYGLEIVLTRLEPIDVMVEPLFFERRTLDPINRPHHAPRSLGPTRIQKVPLTFRRRGGWKR